MPSKRQDLAQPAFSPVLFMTVDGEAMCFFLRPGPDKRKLQPLITAGGGIVCNTQQPGSILLIDPQERNSIPESSAHLYVSIQYIHDCIEKDEQLNLEDYRLNPEVVRRHSARLSNSKDNSPQHTGGRISYSPEEDAAILEYISKHKAKTGGNRLWQEMEKQRVTSHSWQSMKSHYKIQLAKKQSKSAELEKTEDCQTAKEKTEGKEIQATNVQKSSCEEDFAKTDLTQEEADDQPTEGKQSETIDSETFQVSQTESETQLLEAEIIETERDGLQMTVSSRKRILSGDSPSPQPESTPKDSLSKKSKEKQKASLALEQPLRQLTRRSLELEPYGKKLRSSTSSTHEELTTSSSQPLKKTKSAEKSALQKDMTIDQPPLKKAREKTVAAEAVSQEERSAPTTQADETISAPQKVEEKKEKRKLGILELATKEFEDDSESDENEGPALQNPAQTAATSTSPLPSPSDTAADPVVTQSSTEPGASQNVQEGQASSSNCVAETSHQSAAAERVVSEAATSKAHLFIFDSESHEDDDSQSVVGDLPAASSNPQPTANKDDALSLTQGLLEEDKQRIRDLMNQTKQGLVSVTKALLKTSGDFSAALDLLLNPSSVSGPFWNLCDDKLLLSADPVVLQQLQEKYGEESVAKRIVFLEVEG